ncbi:MAG: hypothetical protein IID15_06585, partial [Candidatus Marinimicrobia bacterium]|nr:hypothetical protein [Candidatus Neomarinimicrobiota bacterium]
DAPYKDAGNGPYTHYVDNTATNCDNDHAGGRGDEQNPRCSFPLDLPAGSVVEVHGGPYYTENNVNWALDGTVDAPIFIHGFDPDNRTVIQNGKQFFHGSYMVFENFSLQDNAIIRTEDDPPKNDHMAFRNIEVTTPNVANHSNSIGIKNAEHVVIYDCYPHDNSQAIVFDVHGVLATGDVDLRIDLPKGSYITAKTINGPIEARDVEGRISFKAANGEIEVRGAPSEAILETMNSGIKFRGKGSRVDARTVNGTIDLRGVSGEVVANAISGSIHVQGDVLERADLRSLTGSVELETALAPGARISCKSYSGSTATVMGATAGESRSTTRSSPFTSSSW